MGEETMAELTSMAAPVGTEDIFAVKEKIHCHEGLFLTPDLLLDTHKLPQLVKVTHAECEAPGLSKNEILLLHFTYTSKKVMAQSLSEEGGIVVGPELNIPLAYPGRFELLQNQSNVKVFESLEEVVTEDLQSQMPVVRFLVEEDILDSELPPAGVASPEMGRATTHPQQLLCKKGDVITILSTQRKEPPAPVQQPQEIPELQKKGFGHKLKGKFKGKGRRTSQHENKEPEEQRPKLIFTCSNQDGELVTLPGDLKAQFTLKPLEFESGTTYTVENVIDNFKLPQDVKLVHGDCPGEDDEFTGYVRLFHTYRDEVIVGTSVQDDGQISQVEFSINTDIQFSPADLELSENKEILCLFQSNIRTSVLVDSKNMDSFILVMGQPYSSIYQDRTKLFKPADLATYANVGEIAPTNPIYEETPDYQDPDLHKAVVPSAPPMEQSNVVDYYSPVEPPTEKDDSTDTMPKPEIKPRRNKIPPTAVPVGFVGELKKAQESKKTRPPVPPRPKAAVTSATVKSDQDTSDDYTDLMGGDYTTLKPITASTVEGPTAFAAFENTVYDTLASEGDQPATGKRASVSVKDLVKQMESVDKTSEIVSYKTPLNIRLALPKEPEEEKDEATPRSSNPPEEQGGEYQSPPHVSARSPDELKCQDHSQAYDIPKSPVVQVMSSKPPATGGHIQGTEGRDESQPRSGQVSVGEDAETDTDYDNVEEIYSEIPTMANPSGKDDHGQSVDPSTWVPPDDLSTLSVSEVTACLRHLNLGNDVIAAFERERIDGALLNDVDETIMTQDMNLRKLDALKILKFTRGWRP
ncbi:GAREM2 [Branchiostoma lanceolatum]|uniref:GAREM2 protein n=1 Tax=Branchiostoma lanceolatum TaxID=7740 RepID=A0A8J9ZES3_BRALA|nr:GAREM2 [Branchiostoma lanceolatum]